jgi:uracil phosphoribosyltransferase
MKVSYQHTHVIDHPFITDHLSHLRDQQTEIASFRRHSDHLCQLLFSEAIRGLEFINRPIKTPLEVEITSQRLKDEIIVVPVLRAGLAMLFGAMQLLPKSKVGFVGLQRDERTAIAQEYYWKLPQIRKNSIVIITDPMLATGGSLFHLLKKIAPLNPKEIRIVCVIAAPEGLALIRKEFPNIEIFTAAVDRCLNKSKYIVPGIGDYGDRYFGTTA